MNEEPTHEELQEEKVEMFDSFEQPKKENLIKDPELVVQNKAPAVQPNAIALSDNGLLAPKDSAEDWRIADMMLKSGALPAQFKNVPQVVMANQFLKAHGFNPISAIKQITIINGSLSLWGDLPKALCDRSGLLEEFKEVLFDKDYNEISFENKNLHVDVWGAACTVKRKGSDKSITRSFTMDEAKIAGLLTKNNSVWKFYPRRMIQFRARSLSLKDTFPDVLSGIAICEYDHHVLGPGEDRPELREVKNIVSIQDEINEAVLEIGHEAEAQHEN